MASCSKKTESIRRNKRKKSGKSRKTKEQNKGTTVPFEILFADFN